MSFVNYDTGQYATDTGEAIRQSIVNRCLTRLGSRPTSATYGTPLPVAILNGMDLELVGVEDIVRSALEPDSDIYEVDNVEVTQTEARASILVTVTDLSNGSLLAVTV